MDGASKCSPAAAVPVSTKIPEPMIAPIPRAVRDHGPRVLRRRCSGRSASEISLSMDLQQRSWFVFAAGSVVRSVVGDGPKGPQFSRRKSMSGRKRPLTQHLSLRLSAHQLLHFAFFRSACVLAGLKGMLGFALFAGSAFEFFAFVFAERCCVCHEFLFCNLVIVQFGNFKAGIEARCKLPNYKLPDGLCAVPT